MNRFASDTQLLLLHGALRNGQPAIDAANQWLQEHRLESQDGFRSLDAGSRRLLPLLCRNLKASLSPVILAGLRSVHNEYWAENQKLFRKLEASLQEFHQAGIPAMVLKGAALSILHYRDMATRPMSDCDILIAEESGPGLVRKYLDDGWTPDWTPPDAPTHPYFYRYRHALDLQHAVGGNIDLHWHALLDVCWQGADRAFWDASVPLRVRSFETRTLNPTDQLLHVCVHGYPFNPMPPIRWIADAMMILRTSAIDWQQFVHRAADLSLTIPCAETLGFLNAEFEADVPSGVIEKLATYPTTASERRFFARMADPGARRWWETLEDVWVANRRANRDRSFWMRMATLPRHLQWQQEVSSLPGLIPHFFVFLKRRFHSA